jgi:D-arginine dehydrogenase
MITSEYVIVGAGFAGAATAYHLAREGVGDILIVEQETIAGFHSSGRNAAMVRQCVSDPTTAALTRDGAGFLREPPADWPVPVEFQQNGSLLLGSGEGWNRLTRDADFGKKLGVHLESWSAKQAKAHVPVLEYADFDGGIWCPSDGVVDIHALLSGYLKAAARDGARVRYGSAVQAIRAWDSGGFEVILNDEVVRARVVVNAAGAWANGIAKMARAMAMPLRPCRRHLFVSSPLAWVDPHWPFVWDVSHDIYFRPEAGGLLLCACDQEELSPGDPPVDESVRELLAEKIERYLPGLSSVGIKKAWAGFRTLSADGRFVIGWDGRVENFFWVAGLGGHGVTTSSAVGALAARLILAADRTPVPELSPTRFLA